MKLLQAIHYPVFGGPHNQALQLARPLSKRGWDTVALLPDEPGNAVSRLRDGGVPIVEIPLHRLRASTNPRVQFGFLAGLVPEVARIRRVIRERQIDVVMIGGLVNPPAALAARLEGVPVVWQLLDTRPPMALRRAMMPLVTRLADVVMSTGMEVARMHPGAPGMGARLISFFPPVDTRTFRPDQERRSAARAELGVPEGARLIGTVGNLNPQKGHEYFLRAAALIRQAQPGTVERVLGAQTATHAAYERQLEREVRALGLDDDNIVAFLDPGTRVAELLPAFDVFLLTSVPRSEGVPTVILEAMACGIPVVATDVGGVSEVVEDGVTGFIVPALDPEAIADATVRLLHDGELRRRMGEAGRQRAVELYDVEVCAETHARAFEAALDHHRGRERRRAGIPARDCTPPDLRMLLVCPACRGKLAWSVSGAQCDSCGRTYPIVDGIPVLLLDQSAAGHDELDHLHSHGHKQQQAAFFDREEAVEFETVRPHGTPPLYRWLLLEKFRRSVRWLRPLPKGATALTVCGGSGMDAEFLARSGMRVIASDISIGAARRAGERARRFGLAISPIVADVECLPFEDQAVELVYVHDGLHHLELPAAGLAEMGRVASGMVSVTEPARAGVTALAVRLGLALEREEAGNRVARVTVDELVAALEEIGFRPAGAGRYAMYYRHQPGRVFSVLSRPVLLPLARSGWQLVNGMLGRWGNKVTVQSVRERG